MPDSLPKYTDRAADMTGLIARRARQAAATGRTWSRAVEVIPRLARCSVFKDRSVPAVGGTLRAGTNRLKGDHPVYRRIRARSSREHSRCPGGPGSVAAVSRATRCRGYAEPSTTRAKRRLPTWSTFPSRSPMGMSSLPPSSVRPSTLTPPWPSRRRASLVLTPNASRDQRWQVDHAHRHPAPQRPRERPPAPRGARAAGRSAPRPPSPPRRSWNRATSRRASSRFASPGWRPSSSGS